MWRARGPCTYAKKHVLGFDKFAGAPAQEIRTKPKQKQTSEQQQTDEKKNRAQIIWATGTHAAFRVHSKIFLHTGADTRALHRPHKFLSFYNRKCQNAHEPADSKQKQKIISVHSWKYLHRVENVLSDEPIKWPGCGRWPWPKCAEIGGHHLAKARRMAKFLKLAVAKAAAAAASTRKKHNFRLPSGLQ